MLSHDILEALSLMESAFCEMIDSTSSDETLELISLAVWVILDERLLSAFFALVTSDESPSAVALMLVLNEPSAFLALVISADSPEALAVMLVESESSAPLALFISAVSPDAALLMLLESVSSAPSALAFSAAIPSVLDWICDSMPETSVLPILVDAWRNISPVSMFQ